mgnify:FL=1
MPVKQLKSFVWMLGTLLSFSLMAVGARELSDSLSVSQVLFIRNVIGLGIMLLIIALTGKWRDLRTSRFHTHLFRNVFHFAGQYCWFLGIALLPLAKVFALEFTVPIWTAIIAAVFLKEQLNPRKLLAILLGFLGVLIILGSNSIALDEGSKVVLLSAIFYAIAHTSTKALSSTESPVVVLFYMCAIQLPISFILSDTAWTSTGAVEWLWLLVISITGLSAHYCMTNAMKHTEITLIVIMDFLRLPFIAFVGVLAYGEALQASLIVGALLMLLGNITANTKFKN